MKYKVCHELIFLEFRLHRKRKVPIDEEVHCRWITVLVFCGQRRIPGIWVVKFSHHVSGFHRTQTMGPPCQRLPRPNWSFLIHIQNSIPVRSRCLLHCSECCDYNQHSQSLRYFCKVGFQVCGVWRDINSLHATEHAEHCIPDIVRQWWQWRWCRKTCMWRLTFDIRMMRCFAIRTWRCWVGTFGGLQVPSSDVTRHVIRLHELTANLAMLICIWHLHSATNNKTAQKNLISQTLFQLRGIKRQWLMHCLNFIVIFSLFSPFFSILLFLRVGSGVLTKCYCTFKNNFTKVAMLAKQYDSFNRPTLQPHRLPGGRLRSPNRVATHTACTFLSSSPTSPIPRLDYGLLPDNGSGNRTRTYITDARILQFLCLHSC